MLTIRLARTGRKNLAHYRVVAADSKRTPTGKFVAQLGHYNPHTKELVLDEAKTQEFIDNGAQPSSRMVRILQNHKGIKLPSWAEAQLVVKPDRPKQDPDETETADKAEAGSDESGESDGDEAAAEADTDEGDGSEADAETEAAEDTEKTEDKDK